MLLSELFGEKSLKTLYVCRHLKNTSEFISWVKSQNIPSVVPEDELHCTISYSKEPVDWSLTKPKTNELKINGGSRKIEKFGEAVVLRFESDEIYDRWKEFVDDIGCSWDHDTMRPHITITYKGGKIDINLIKPFKGELIFGPEEFTEVNSKASLKK